MLMHSSCSILFNMLSGFDLNSKGFKTHLKINLEIWFGKRKGNSFPPPSLPHFRPAGPIPRRPARPLPFLPFLFSCWASGPEWGREGREMNFLFLFPNQISKFISNWFFIPFKFKSKPLNILNKMLQHECINMCLSLWLILISQKLLFSYILMHT